MSNPTPSEPTPQDRKKIAALLVIYLNALQHGPDLTDSEWSAAEEIKTRIAAEFL